MSITLRLSSLMGTLAVTAVTAAPAGAAPADIVFSDGGDLYARNLDGGKRPLTHGRPFDEFPAWSPDRSRIASVRDGDLHVARADGSAVRWIARRPGFDRYPAWSPDGPAHCVAAGESMLWRARSPHSPANCVASVRREDN